MPLLICSNEFPDFVFSGESAYEAKLAWELKYEIKASLREINRYSMIKGSDNTRLVDVNETTKLIFPNHTHADFLIVDSDNNVLATIHKSPKNETQKPISNIFWFNGDTCSINLESVERTVYYSDTGVIDIHLKSTSLVILGGDVAKQFIAQYKAFTAK